MNPSRRLAHPDREGGRHVRLLSRSGTDLTKRLGRLATELEALPARSAVIDGELVLADERGAPNFYALQSALSRWRDAPYRVFVFDMMHKNGADLRALPLVKRKKRLAAVISDAVPAVQFVDMFDDGARLLASCAKMGLEGIVSKRRDAPYQSGPSRDWVKVKTDNGVKRTGIAGASSKAIGREPPISSRVVSAPRTRPPNRVPFHGR